MRKVCSGFLMLLMAVFAASAAPAPVREAPPLGGLVGSMLQIYLSPRSNVREELKLSEDQGKNIDKLAAEYREALRGMRELAPVEQLKKHQELLKANEEALAKILTRKQFKRVEQIRLQQLGARAFASSPQVVAAIKLTEEQQKQMAAILSEALEKRVALRQEGATEERLAEEDTKRNEKLLNVLTVQQKAKWKELLGEPFKVRIRRAE